MARRPLGVKLRNAVLERDKGICAMCGVDCIERRQRMFEDKDFTASLISEFGNVMCNGQTWEVDHVVPVAEGGADREMANLRTLCVPCHRKETNAYMRSIRHRWRA